MAKHFSVITTFLLLAIISTSNASKEATVNYEWEEDYSSPVPTTTTEYYNPYDYQPTTSPPSPQYYQDKETATPSSPQYYQDEETPTPSSPQYYQDEETPTPPSPQYYQDEETPTPSSPHFQHEETPTPPSPHFQHEETPTPPSPKFHNEETPTSTTSEKYQFMAPQNAARLSLGLTPLRWDDTLAAYAQSWANQRRQDCAMIHSDTSYGENIWWGSSSGYTARYAVQSWVDERMWYDYNSNSCMNRQDCGHYTQIVWSTSTKIGCARVVCDNDGGVFVTCNYDPPGNIIGGRPY